MITRQHTPSPGTPGDSYDTIIIGAGSMGLAAAYYLSRAGQSVLLLDRFEPPHTFGSHHGDTRLLRVAYGEGSVYVPLVLRARTLWQELEQSAASWGPARARSQITYVPERLFASTGVIGLLHPDSDMLPQIEASVADYGLPSETLTASEAQQRWSGLTPAEEEVVHVDPLGGVLFSEACIRAYKHGCALLGAEMKFGGAVERIDVQGKTVKVAWSGESYRASHLILAPGAGAPQLLGQFFPDWHVPLQPVRKTVAWFEAGGGSYRDPQFPAFYADGPAEMFYGFPDFGDGVKVGRHDGGTPCTPDSVDREFHPEDESDLRRFLGRALRGANGSRRRGVVCMYTLTPDEHFVIDRHPDHEQVLLCAGFSGHGFKFASAIGEALSEMILNGSTTCDLSLFRADRFGA